MDENIMCQDVENRRSAKTITIIIPALNEEANIRHTYHELMDVLQDQFEDYEVLIFNDGSTDRTGDIINKLANENPHVKAIHNEANKGIGYNYLTGIKMSRMNYTILIPGDNEYLPSSIKKMFKFVEVADIVTSFSVNMEDRPYLRRILSRLYTLLINTIFNLELNYYNGMVIHRRDILQKIKVSTFGFAYQSLILTQLIRSGYTFVEVGVYLRSRSAGRSTALKFKNVISVLGNVTKHWVKVRLIERQKYNLKGKRIILDNELF